MATGIRLPPYIQGRALMQKINYGLIKVIRGFVGDGAGASWARAARERARQARAIAAGSTPSSRVMVTLACSAALAAPRKTPLIGGTSG